MNELALLHIPNSNYCYASGEKSVALRLRVDKADDVETVKVIYENKYDFGTKQKVLKMKRTHEGRIFSFFTANILLEDVRFVYVFLIETKKDRFYYSEDGISTSFDFKLGYYNAFQLPYINKIDLMEEVAWTKNAVVYQIFVDRFAIGDNEKNNDYINLKWGLNPTPKSYAGGDLKGIINNIDYIKNLGVNTIYLTPIFKADSNHKYNTDDYMKIDSQFGNAEDLKKLVEICHKKHIKILLDAVFNHCADTISQFEDVKKFGKQSKYFNWFIINGDKINKEPCNYETFGACYYMPKLNTSNIEVQNFLINIALYWIREFNIDGWRLDVSDEVSHHFWKRFRTKIKAEFSQSIIIGENWHDAYPFLRGDEYDSIMNYAFTKACLDLFAFNKFNASEFAFKLNDLLMRNTDIVNNMMLNLLDSHDTYRFFTEVNEDESKLICAIAIMFFYPGMPMIYYGTENNMQGNYDPDNRRTFDWELAKCENQTKSVIKQLSKLKTSGFINGACSITAKNGVLTIAYENNGKIIQLIANIDNDETDFNNKDVIFDYLSNENKLKKFGFIIKKGW